MTTSGEFDDLAQEARDVVYVENAFVDLLASRVMGGQMSEAEGVKQLHRLIDGESLPFELINMQQVSIEWNSLMEGMKEEATQWQAIAKSQYRQAFYLLPIAVVVVLAATVSSIHWLRAPEAAVAAVSGASLIAISAHSFFVFRIHQQARIAAERLSEKRAASLFLRLALSRSNPTEAPQILATAAAMFLGHQAPATIPLQPQDLQRKAPI